MNKENIINGRDIEWKQKAQQLAALREPFTIVKFNYLENFTYCRCHIEQKHGFKHESTEPNVHRFVPIPDFKKPTHNLPHGFMFSGNPED